MPKREWIGDPIDATMSYITERNGGKAVGGTTDDDKGDETTEAIPSFIDEGDLSPWQEKILREKILHQNWSLQRLTDEIDTNYTKTSGFLSEFRQEYRDELEEAGMFEKLLFPMSPKSGTYNQKTETQSDSAGKDEEKESVRDYFRKNPDASITDLRSDLEIENLTSSMIGGIKGNMIKHGLLDEKDDTEKKEEETGSRERTTTISTRTDTEYAEEIDEYADSHEISRSEALERAIQALSQDYTLEKALENAEEEDELIGNSTEVYIMLADMHQLADDSRFEEELHELLKEAEETVHKIVELRQAEVTRRTAEEYIENVQT